MTDHLVNKFHEFSLGTSDSLPAALNTYYYYYDYYYNYSNNYNYYYYYYYND